MFLRAGLLDRVDSSEICDPASDFDWKVQEQAAQESAPECITGASRVDDLASRGGWNASCLPIDDEIRAVLAIGDDNKLLLGRDVGDCQASFALEDRKSVV